MPHQAKPLSLPLRFGLQEAPVEYVEGMLPFMDTRSAHDILHNLTQAYLEAY